MLRLFVLVALTMVAFAANSVLTRIGVFTYDTDPLGFAAVRVAAGAMTLGALVALRGQSVFSGLLARWKGALALAVYMIGFSLGYLGLEAGLGALILFGVLQVILFGWAVAQHQEVPVLRWIGAGCAMVGLGVLLWPTQAVAVPFAATMAMIAAAVGWAVYTVLGQGAGDPLATSAGNFILCLPIVGLALIMAEGGMTPAGFICAVIAGSVTSGLGYALWYHVLPQIPTTVAAIAQLSVPVIAVLGGVLFLQEAVTARMLIAGCLVLGGIAVSSVKWVPADHR